MLHLTRPAPSAPFVAGLLALVSAIVRPFARRAARKDWDANVRKELETMASKPRVAKLLPTTSFRLAYMALPGAATVQPTVPAPTVRPVPMHPAPVMQPMPTVQRMRNRPTRKPTRPVQHRSAAECAQRVEMDGPAFVADPTPDPTDDGLAALKRPALLAICEAECVKPARSNAETVARIRAKRKSA